MKWQFLIDPRRPLLAMALAVGMALAASGRARADVVIDDFSDPTPTSQGLDSGNGPGPAGTYTPFSLGPDTAGSFSSIVGGYRTMNLSGTIYTNQSVAFRAGNGNADLSTSSLSSGMASLLYDANGSGLGGLLAGLTSIEIQLSALNFGTTGVSIAVTLMDNSGMLGGMQTLTQEFMSNLGATLLMFDFSTTTVDLTDLKSVLVQIQGLTNSTAFDVTIENITAIIPPPPPPPPVPPVPEPASIALWCLVGLVGTGYGIRRRRRAA